MPKSIWKWYFNVMTFSCHCSTDGDYFIQKSYQEASNVNKVKVKKFMGEKSRILSLWGKRCQAHHKNSQIICHSVLIEVIRQFLCKKLKILVFLVFITKNLRSFGFGPILQKSMNIWIPRSFCSHRNRGIIHKDIWQYFSHKFNARSLVM